MLKCQLVFRKTEIQSVSSDIRPPLLCQHQFPMIAKCPPKYRTVGDFISGRYSEETPHKYFQEEVKEHHLNLCYQRYL